MNAQPPEFGPQMPYNPYATAPQHQAPAAGYSAPAQGGQAGHPAHSGQPVPPPRPGRGPAVPLLSVLVALLTIILGAVSTLAVQAQGRLDKVVSAQQHQAALDAKDTVVPGTLVKPDLDLAALRTKLKAAKDANAAANTAITNWDKGGLKFSVILDAMDSCFFAANDFDVAAAPFSPDELKGLPLRIDTDDTATDCGRSLLRKISGQLA